MALADLMLVEILARGCGALLLEPRTDDYVLTFSDRSNPQSLARVPRELALAAIERLQVVAGLGSRRPQVGRIRLHLASHKGTSEQSAAETLLSVHAASGGATCELHALSQGMREDEGSAVAGIDGAPTPRPEVVKYRVSGELGRGGMGIVYRATHLALDKDVALKVLSPEMAQRKSLADQFVVEGRAACRARHPAIVDVTDFGRLSDGRNYLVMELIEWPTLAEEVAEGPVELTRALRLAREIARGLAAAHAQGVVHRDLKPANVFVSGDGRVKVGDFGLAYSADLGDENLEGLFGTIPYMAPELVTSSSGSPAADLYAFGCILHELLTGAPPYGTMNTQRVVARHRTAPVPPLEVPGHEASLGLIELHGRLLAKEPAARPPSFDEVVRELDDLLEELS